MNLKRFLLLVLSILISLLLIYGWVKYNEGGPAPYPINIGSFFTVENGTIDPTTLLEDVQAEKEPLFLQVQSDLPEDPPFIMSIGWSQNNYLEIAHALFKAIWKDDSNEWRFYRASFYTDCENPTGKFESATLYYYQEVKMDGKRMYSVRAISIEPQYGYVAWGGDTFYPRPIIGKWAEIDSKKIAKVPAEKALALAEQQGGSDIRMRVSNACWVHVDIWPWGYERNDWMVTYGGTIDLSNDKIWIPLK